MECDPSAKPTPRDAHIVQGLGFSPFLEGLFADLEEDSTTPLALGTHDMHAL